MASSGRRIAVLNLTSTHGDPRVLRMGSMLVEMGHEVAVFEMLLPGLSERDTLKGMQVHRIPVPNRYTDDDMAEIGQTDAHAASVIEQAHPWVYRLPPEARPPTTRLGRLALRAWRKLVPEAPSTEPTPAQSLSKILPIRSIMLVNLAIFRAAREFAPDIVHCNDLNTMLAGVMLKRALGTKVVYDAHEIYPEQFAPDQRSEIWHTFYTRLDEQLVHAADAKLTVCDSLGEYFDRTYGAKGFVTVRNLPSLRQLAPGSVLERKRERPIVLYHGSYVPFRGLEEMIDAAKFVDGAKFRFRGVGEHGKTLEAMAKARGMADRIEFVPPVKVEELVPTASECDVGLSPFVPVCKNTEFALPNKFFEYLMAGLACASSNLVEMQRLTDRHQVGVLFPNQDPRVIADSLNALIARPDALAQYRANALSAARSELNWETEAQRFRAFYEPLLRV